MIKRIIFDLDNTLIMTKSFLVPNQRALKRVGIDDIEKAKLLDFCGDDYDDNHSSYNRKDFLEFINKRLSLNLDESFMDILLDEFKNCVPKNFNEEKSVLEYLHSKYELVILTNYFKDVQEARLVSAGVRHLFLDITGEDCLKPRKEAYINACGNHKPEECIMIGDNYALDVEAPRTFGLSSIWITQKEKSNGKDIINNLSELKDIL